MKVAVVGCGPVGLATGVGLASVGHTVTAFDASAERRGLISRGRVPFHEPGLAAALATVMEQGRFCVAGELERAAAAELIMICVGTPSQDDGSIDLSMVRSAVTQLTQLLRGGAHHQVIVVRSTVVPGTTESLVLPLVEAARGSRRGPLGVAVNPEFLREGRALEDVLHPDRIVIGAADPASDERLSQVYETFRAPLIHTTPTTAEMIKYTSNALLATLISFSNEIARICESMPGVRAHEVLGGVHLDRRLTAVVEGRRIPAGIIHYLKAGCGYGGSCLPKDLRALLAAAKARGVVPRLLEAVNAVNESQPAHVVTLAERWLGSLHGLRTVVLGLSFKEGTDDVRESPGLAVAKRLLERGASVTVADPLVTRAQVREILEAGAAFADDPIAAFHGAEACFLTTLASEFRFIESVFRAPSPGVKRPLVIDGRWLLADAAPSLGEGYRGVGMGSP